MSRRNPVIRFSIAPRILAASLELKGPYSSWGRGLMELKAWMDRSGISASGRPFALFYDNPGEKPGADLRSEACIPVAEPFKSEGKFRFREFSECLVAETRHEGTPNEYKLTYGSFLEQLLRSGYRLVGPAREFFESPSAWLGPGMGVLIQQPIGKVVRSLNVE